MIRTHSQMYHKKSIRNTAQSAHSLSFGNGACFEKDILLHSDNYKV